MDEKSMLMYCSNFTFVVSVFVTSKLPPRRVRDTAADKRSTSLIFSMMQPGDHRYNFKCIAIGDSGVGKSQITRVAGEVFSGELRTQPNGDAAGFSRNTALTVGVDFLSSVIALRSKKTGETVPVKVSIWDTAGQESFRSISRSYFRGSVASLVVFDLTNHATFESSKSWYQEMKENCNTNCSILLVGNKADLVNLREVATEEAQDFATQHGINYIETSARTGQNVAEAFRSVAEQVLAKVENGELDLVSLGGTKARANLSSVAASSSSGTAGGAVGTVTLGTNRGGLEAKPGGEKKCCG